MRNGKLRDRCVRVLLAGLLAPAMTAACSPPDDLPWEPARTVATAGRIGGPPAVVDVDGDGNPDLLVVGAGDDEAAPAKLFVFIGDGAGRFERHDHETDLLHPGGALWLATGDVDEDGRPDAVVGHHDSYDLAILLGDGRGGFKPAPVDRVTTHSGTDAHTHSLALADVNGDEYLDILTTCADDNAVAVLLGDGSGRFGRASDSPFEAGRHPYEGLSVGMLNDDEHADVVVTNLWGSAVTVLLGDGTGRFESAPGSPIAVGSRPGFIALGDLNGDARADAVVTHDGRASIEVLLGGGPGGLTPAEGSPISLSQSVWGAVIDDVVGDEANDVVLGGSEDRLIVLRGDGRGGFESRPLEIPMPRAGPGRVRVADLNGDGRPDLVVTYYGENVIDVCFGRAPP